MLRVSTLCAIVAILFYFLQKVFSLAMTLLAIILALALEQIHPLGNRNRVLLVFTRYANYLERHLNAGRNRHGVLAWCLAVLPLAGFVWLIHGLLYKVTPALALIWDVAVLYLTMGFRHFSSALTEISVALAENRVVDARSALARWSGQPTSELEVNEISRLTIEQGVIDSYRHVFGTMFWFAVLPGPAGAVMYRMSNMLYQKWGGREEVLGEAFGRFARRFHEAIDWLPVRLTSASFAVMGDFEDAVFCWRSQAIAWGHYAYGILLASAAGAIGVKLGDPLRQDYTVKYRPELGVGDEADPDYLRRAVGLVWRSVVLWLAVILLLTLVQWLSLS